MGIENLFITTKKSIGGVTLDATILEAHSNRVRITKNPVEMGADITDHAIIEPKQLTLIVEVSDSPIGVAAIGVIVDNVTGLFGSATSNNSSRSITAYNAMVALMANLMPLEIFTKLRVYSNMMITGIDTTQDKDTSRMVRMFIELEEVIVVGTETITIEADQLEEGAISIQGGQSIDKGRQEVSAPSDSAQDGVTRSVLKWVVG